MIIKVHIILNMIKRGTYLYEQFQSQSADKNMYLHSVSHNQQTKICIYTVLNTINRQKYIFAQCQTQSVDKRIKHSQSKVMYEHNQSTEDMQEMSVRKKHAVIRREILS